MQNAIDQAEAVAANMLGAGAAYEPKPWFWSDQYDMKLQIAGLNTGYDRVVVREAEGARSFWYYAGERLLAVDAINAPRDYMVGKRLIEAGRSPDPDHRRRRPPGGGLDRCHVRPGRQRPDQLWALPGRPPGPAVLADPSTDLKALLRP